MLVNVVLLISGVVIPWMISAFYMRRYRLYEQDYLPQTFLPAPLAGLLATLILPQIYLIYQIMTTSDMLKSSNGFLILLTLIFFGSNVLVCALQIRQARFIIGELNQIEARWNNIGLGRPGRGQYDRYGRRVQRATPVVDINENVEKYIPGSFDPNLTECQVCLE